MKFDPEFAARLWHRYKNLLILLAALSIFLALNLNTEFDIYLNILLLVLLIILIIFLKIMLVHNKVEQRGGKK